MKWTVHLAVPTAVLDQDHNLVVQARTPGEARLIASASDLLSALTALVESIENVNFGVFDDDGQTYDAIPWSQAEAAIDEATGKEVYMPKFEIQTIYDGEWSNECPGGANVFDSASSAEKAIAELKQLGDDWIDAEYRVVAIRDEVGK